MATHLSSFTHAHHPRAASMLRTASVLLALLALTACATTPTAAPDAEPPTKTNSKNTSSPSTETSTSETKFVPPEPAAEPVAEVAKTETVSIDVSCKSEPYSKYEKQSRDSIAKGLSATTAGTYGVGFRDLKEHKRWSKTHNELFKAVNSACVTLSKCAKKHPKDKTKQCAQQAEQFAQWQGLSKQFTEKAKQSEFTQPPKICSFTANLDDAASCFHALGDNVDKACTGSVCKETSDCWRGIGFLDYAINQAISACRFSRMELSECRGYTTATQRRKTKFERCTQMQKDLNVRVIPVL
jgi:hypothetical protein